MTTPSASRALRITTETTIASTDVDATVAALRTAIAEFGGYVSDAKTQGNDSSRSADLEARVPADKLAAFRAKMAEQGDVIADNEKAEDVTEQRADLQARLRNARTQEKRLLDIMSDRTGNLADVITAEKALSETRDTVERLEAQNEVLERQIALATVKLHVQKKRELVAARSTGDKIIAAGSKGVDIAGDVVVGIAVATATLGPTLLLLAAVCWFCWFVGKRVSRLFPRKITPPVFHPAHAHQGYAPPPEV